MLRRKKLEQLLNSRGITAYQLSEMLGYRDKTTVYKWLYGIGEPDAATMLLLMEVFDVSAEKILQAFAEISVIEE